ncbi:MAG: hypothetical protein ACREJU_15410, partial [Nitrospiraceae bacterium]
MGRPEIPVCSKEAAKPVKIRLIFDEHRGRWSMHARVGHPLLIPMIRSAIQLCDLLKGWIGADFSWRGECERVHPRGPVLAQH